MEKSILQLQQEIVDLKKQVLEFEQETLKRAKRITTFCFCVAIISAAIAVTLWILLKTNNQWFVSHETIIAIIVITIGIIGVISFATGDIWRTKKLVCEHKVHQATCELNFAEYDLENMRNEK